MTDNPLPLLARVLASTSGADGLTREQVAEAAAQVAALQGRLADALRALPDSPPAARTPTPERLLSVTEAAGRLGVTARWLYRNARRLPFARKLTRRTLRFHEAGLERYIREKRP